jgi:hypothetical protein
MLNDEPVAFIESFLLNSFIHSGDLLGAREACPGELW